MATSIGLPEINVIFIQKAETAIRRSEKGIVMLLLVDTVANITDKVYTSYEQAAADGWTDENKKYLELTFAGNPNKVYVHQMASGYTIADEIKKLGNWKWNYLAFPKAVLADQTAIIAWIKARRDTDHKIYKYCGGGLATPDNEGIINFDSENVKISNYSTKLKKEQYACRIAGLAAGCPLTESLTYQVMSEVESFDELDDDDARNAAIKAGKLILINDGEKIRIARGVNSLTTTTNTKGEKFCKIRFIETKDTITEDITTTIKNEWLGKTPNTYDNKLILAGAVTSYLNVLVGEELLDGSQENKCVVDFEAQRKYLQDKGVDVDNMDDLEILKYNTGDKVFLKVMAYDADTMEDFDIKIYV